MASNKTSQLIGRESEKATLKRALNSNEAEFVAIFGRWRVGKTFLVRQYFENQFCFQLTGTHQASRSRQLFLTMIVNPTLKGNSHNVGLVTNQIDAEALFR